MIPMGFANDDKTKSVPTPPPPRRGAVAVAGAEAGAVVVAAAVAPAVLAPQSRFVLPFCSRLRPGRERSPVPVG